MIFSNERYIKQVFDKHYQNLCFFAFTLTKDRVLSEDFAQEAFISFVDKFDKIVANEKVYKAFLYTSVKNSILNWHRRNNVEKKYHELTPFKDFEELDFDNALIKAEAIGEINKLINDLPAACQNIFRLYYIEGLSTKEIASQLNLSLNTIKTQKQRGLSYVRSNLNPEYFALLIFLIK